ncbi:MAG TPA: non-heme iron oxygenase ferredoxin subunit [Demequinaceae bacterium]
MSEHVACKAKALAPGTALRADLALATGGKHAFAVVRTEDGELFAIDDTCSHAEVSLSEGDVDGCEIECWAHGSRFDLRTGEPDELPAMTPIRTYPVRIDGDDVLVDVDAPMSTAKENA